MATRLNIRFWRRASTYPGSAVHLPVTVRDAGGSADLEALTRVVHRGPVRVGNRAPGTPLNVDPGRRAPQPEPRIADRAEGQRPWERIAGRTPPQRIAAA